MANSSNNKNTSSNKQKKTSECTNNSSNTASQQGLGLASISYADYVILSATLSFAIAEELNDADLDMLIVFFGMVTSDLALLRTKRGITNALSEQDTSEEAIIGSEEASEGGESIASLSSTLRGRSRKKSKRIKKVKKKKRKSSNGDSLKREMNKNFEN